MLFTLKPYDFNSAVYVITACGNIIKQGCVLYVKTFCHNFKQLLILWLSLRWIINYSVSD